MLDQAGIDVLAHMRMLTMTRIESLNHSLFHLRDSLPILVAEYERMIAEHEQALQYEMDVLRRHDAHMQGALYAQPGQVGAQVLPLPPANNIEIARLPPQPQPPAPPMSAQVGGAPLPPMSNGLGVLAQAVVGANSSLHATAVREAVPIPQSTVKAVMYEPGESRPPEALPGHMDPNGPPPRSAEELAAARDAERARVAALAALPAPGTPSPSEG